MEKISILIGIIFILFIVGNAIALIIYFNPNWKAELPEYFGDSYFKETIIPLGLKIESDYLAGKNLTEEARFLSKNLLHDQKRFIWLWDYSIKNKYHGLQKILIDVSKIRFYFLNIFFKEEIFPIILKIEEKIENKKNINDEMHLICCKLLKKPKEFIFVWDYSMDYKKVYLQKILIKILNSFYK